MRKNPLGDFVLGTLGGTLTSYFAVGALIVFFTGEVLSLGPGMPVLAAPDSGAIMQFMVRLLQTIYFCGLAMIAFVGFRFMQEVLRGHQARQAFKEALDLPRLW
jgi:hypothetical protein